MKKRSLVSVFIAVVFLIAFSDGVFAEVKTGSFELTPNVGGYVFEGNQDISKHALFGLGFGYNFTQRIGMEFLINYADTNFDIGSQKNDLDMVLFRCNYLYSFPMDEQLIPFVSAGYGLAYFNPERGHDNTDFLVDYGVGVKYLINEAWSFRSDIQHIITFDNHHNNLAYTVGLSYLFGGKKAAACPKEDPYKDTDGDGVYDYWDKCPGTPAGTVVDSRGCPLLDSDGDGVFDNMDKCPDTPSGAPVDSDGCPLDSDGDGVYDYEDKCPGTPSGVRVDMDGCEIVAKSFAPMDSDGDGVVDNLDQCPNTPKGASVDVRGCWAIKNLLFEFGKANVLNNYYGDLDNVVSIINRNPDLTIRIDGHTDSIGSAAFNKGLSQRRANAVKQYIIEKGVDPERLPVRGFGFDKPATSNDTAEGRAKNRRVELTPK